MSKIPPIRVQVADKTPINCNHQVTLSVQLDEHNFEVDFLVLDSLLFDFILGCHFLRQHGFAINFLSNTLELIRSPHDLAIFPLRVRELTIIPPFSELLVDVQGIITASSNHFFVTQHPSLLPDVGVVVAKGVLTIPANLRFDHIAMTTIIAANVTKREITFMPGSTLCQVEVFEPNDYDCITTSLCSMETAKSTREPEVSSHNTKPDR